MVHNCTWCVNNASTSLDEPQTDLHVFSMVPRRIESPNRLERTSSKHRTGAIRKTRFSWPCSVFTSNFHRTDTADNIAIMGEDGASSDGHYGFSIGNWFRFCNHCFNPIWLGANIDVSDGHPFTFRFFDRPLTPRREAFCGLSEHSNRRLRILIFPFEQAFLRSIR